MLSPREEKIALALAAAAIPPGATLSGGDDDTVARLEQWLADGSSLQARGVRGLLWAAEVSALASTGHTLSHLPRAKTEALLEKWRVSRSHARRSFVRALLSPIKIAHFDHEPTHEKIGSRTPSSRSLTQVDEVQRWTQQIIDGNEASEDLDLECDVVVIGSGAGGAACAYELASRGRAVVLLEEGDFHRRSSFTARPAEMSRKLYRDQGMTVALGNVGIPVWAGRAVGGSTVINSGTCYRATDRIFKKWRDDMGLEEFSSESLDPYFSRVESMLQVAPAKMDLTGGIGRVISRGASALGMSHHPLNRNAPDCDGQGVCCFGCPTGAKRSTDVSYVPETLKRGGVLVTAARADAFDIERGQCKAVRGSLGKNRRFRIRAQATVVAGGALMTPVILKRAGLLKKTSYVGKNLSIHPASKVMAVFDETIDMGSGIPQGYAVDEFKDEGIMFEGASMPLDLTALGVPWVGARFTEMMERYRHAATFGFMIEDTSRGTVRAGMGGSPLITYDMNDFDAQKMGRAVSILCEIFLAAGAKRVAPMLPGFDEVRTTSDLAKLRNTRFSPSEFEVTAYHPLGTCRIGVDPKTSVCRPDHETHEIESLYIADGSAVPSALGVNPQMTIMAMALRCGEIIDSRLG
ncbi:MAG: GMC family oxidoreductase [Polyangiaceae bacterium]